ncbi:MAG: 2,5-diamino-6-(ribosylamino)-4(3H)-pyrimidinone 5'-phosphate reductase [Methanobacteriaceae archaeon]|nr:2,5-diamino-6-(ribosylamino)-4(3H)-pyrimidinone 5'-phosphate reductase [Methanobacteriaceae archaeon]
MNNKRPYIHINTAMTIDGKIAPERGSINISNKKDLLRVHKLRKEYDAILVGINTILVDDSRLTVHKIPCNKDNNPIRIIIDSNLKTPLNAKAVNDEAKTIIVTTKKASQETIKKHEQNPNVNIVICGDKQVNLKLLFEILYSMKINSILVEGGSTINYSLFKENLVDKLTVCIAPMILGGRKSNTLVDGNGFDKDTYKKLELINKYMIDEDIILEYKIKKN